ncbi:type II 3-dehydroquinate dehydratase [Bacillus carboniphilus]|uniref:3-dehydroquinate dehydratase n=1 Tax=Bacillus carboniphilus TaxID=86663 RepID=A0ABN0WT65_9BACI
MKRIVVLNGPNLNLLGSREVSVYGSTTLKDIENSLRDLADTNGVELDFWQSNHEGQIIDWLHDSNSEETIGVIINPGAFTHYSYAIRDAVAAIRPPVIEVHISNVHARESFRHHSVIAPVCEGQILGLGVKGYKLAFQSFFL